MIAKTGKLYFLLFSAALMLSVTDSVYADDVTNAQRNAYEARKAYLKNKSNQKQIKNQIAQQEKRIEEEEKRLKQLKAEEKTAKAKLEQSKIDLDEKVKVLNNVWEKRNY